jgi:ribonuclease G
VRLDSEKEYRHTVDCRERAPTRARRPRAAVRQAQNIFEEHGISTEVERALHAKVWLPSGGYLVINQTEALVAVDVNTGRFVGKKNLEDTILKTTSRPAGEIVGRSACAISAASSWSTSSTWSSARAARR